VSVRIVVTDLESGVVTETVLDAGDYAVWTAEPCYLDNQQHHTNGTTLLTLKGCREMGTVRVQPAAAGDDASAEGTHRG
jgi:hypothetical protein